MEILNALNAGIEAMLSAWLAPYIPHISNVIFYELTLRFLERGQ